MRINPSIKLILRTYLLVLSVFSIFRIILFLTERDRLDFENTSISTIVQAFIMGIRFDTVISSYILFLPATILFIFDILGKNNNAVRQFFFYWIFLLFTIAFIISSADIPYFNHFFDRFSIGAFEWIENIDFVFSMIIQEPKYFLIVIPFLILTVLFYFFLKKIFAVDEQSIQPKPWLRIISSFFILLFMFVGIRGRIQKKSPIRIGTAYFSDNAFLNKLGLNPVFTFMQSCLDDTNPKNVTVKIMDEKQAIKNIQKYLNIDSQKYKSPIARHISFDTTETINPNIVIIIMEGMSAAKMKRHGNKKNLTPFLDSLVYRSIYFDNIYTTGKHTFNGVFSTLYSYPALFRQHPMKNIQKYDGLSATLLRNGYSTNYFTTHDSQFDNIEGFLRANDFQNIISQSNYPISEIKSTLGVPDDYMFRYSIPILNELSETKKPFFATFMTASDHGPYYVPDYFEPKSHKIQDQILEYADWSLNTFISLSSKQKWFDNTIFIFIADHGAPINAKYDIALNFFHSPLIFYAPKIFKQDTIHKCIGSQIDVYPTLMGMIKIPYINNTLGVDLLNEKRKYALINDDDKIGVIDTTYFCILKNNETKLYLYNDNDMTDFSKQNVELVKEMTDYVKSNLQVYQNMILKKETTLNNSVYINQTKQR